MPSIVALLPSYFPRSPALTFSIPGANAVTSMLISPDGRRKPHAIGTSCVGLVCAVREASSRCFLHVLNRLGIFQTGKCVSPRTVTPWLKPPSAFALSCHSVFFIFAACSYDFCHLRVEDWPGLMIDAGSPTQRAWVKASSQTCHTKCTASAIGTYTSPSPLTKMAQHALRRIQSLLPASEVSLN